MNKKEIQQEKIKRIYNWSQGNKSGPIEAEIFPTNRCNLSCKYCSVPEDKPKDISREKLKDTVNQLLSLGVKEFSFSGGEPFLKKESLLKVMKKIKQNGGRGIIITNGTLFNRELVEKIVRAGWDEIQISLDGPDALTNDSTRGGGTFKRIIKSLSLFEELKERYNSEKPQITINTVLNQKNWDKFIELIEFLNEFSCNSLLVQALFYDTEESKDLKMDKSNQDSFEKKIKEAISLAEDYDISTNLEGFLDQDVVENSEKVPDLLKKSIEQDEKNNFLKIPCYQPWYRIAIKEDGKIGPCGILAENSQIKIQDGKLSEIWYNDYQKLRDMMKSGNLSQTCEKCCSENIFHNETIREKLKKKLNN